MALSPPVPITTLHLTDHFDCGQPSMNEWLMRRALKNETRGFSRTYVVCRDQLVVAYYTLCTGAVLRHTAPNNIQPNAPEDLPVLVLGRLAVNQADSKQGIGSGLLKDAMLRTLAVSEQAGVVALIVHALNSDVVNFYIQPGFIPSPFDELALFLPVKAIQTHL